jgi:hypothetical protein
MQGIASKKTLTFINMFITLIHSNSSSGKNKKYKCATPMKLKSNSVAR